jgi:rod shape-determining protein MreC
LPSIESHRTVPRGPGAGPVFEIRRRTGLLFLLVVLAQLVLISAQVTTPSGTSVFRAVVFAAVSEVQRTSAFVINSVGGAWSRYVSLAGVARDNERLREQLSAVGVELQQQRTRALRADRLELLLDLREAIALPTLPASVIAGDPSAYFRTVTINRGARDGVRADMAVLSARGVVGRVIGSPAPRASQVQLLIDRDAGAGGLVERSRAGGIVVGDDGQSSLRMEYVSNLADAVVGDIVVTSGLDGIYPKGFVIGQIEAVSRGQGLYKDVRIRPSVEFASVEEVLVVLTAPRERSAEGDRR